MTVGISFRAVPGYFGGYEKEGAGPVDSLEVDHLKIIRDLVLPRDTETRSYKLFVIGRHGQGYHNAAIERYGQEEWDAYWAKLDGDEYGDWVDSRLTPLGKKQVGETGALHLEPLTKKLGGLPDLFFSSPMRRCLETFAESWKPAFSRDKRETVEVRIIENLRETLGEHPCDRRVAHSETVAEYQNYKYNDLDTTISWLYPEDYPEEDQLWTADHRETDNEIDERIGNGLQELFKQVQPNQRFLSLTCHSGVIASVLRNLDHPAIKNLQTGKLVYTVVEIEKTA
ncbi:putative phosphoglycerate mutase PMU1 [Nakaseomyces bracarensis]|uniref:Phosphoglycerate mutase PMU1 n=1 Tax=Nakaseomyces bracarensis TaxID=273131 RepID=A0ABR4NMI2_9SACH